MARQLERLRVDIIEAGFAIASPEDFRSVEAISQAVSNCTVASLARCTKGDIDAAWNAVKGAKHPRIHVFLATSDIHMESYYKNEIQKNIQNPGRKKRIQRAFGIPNTTQDGCAEIIQCNKW